MNLFSDYNVSGGKLLKLFITIASVWINIIFYPDRGFAIPANSFSFAIPDSSFYNQYPFVRFVNENDSLTLTDEQFFDQAGKIIFPVNKTALPQNDSLLSELSTKVIPQMNKDSLELTRILLRGAASPEGPFWNNKSLGHGRANSLLEFLKKNLQNPVSDDVLSSEIVVEDYRSLCLLMRRAGDPDYELVSKLCDTYLPNHCYTLLKNRLMQVKDGKLWKRLLRQYFPQLRAARMILVVKKLKPAPVKVALPSDHATSTVIVKPQEKTVEAAPEPHDEKVPLRELLSVKTNLLFYGAYIPGYNRWCPIPNIAVEYYPRRGHFTFGASFDCPWWKNYSRHKFFEVRNYQLETRYYFKTHGADEANGTHEAHGAHGTHGAYKNPGAAYRGFYVQGYVHAGLFEIGFNADKGWKGEGVGVGLGLGYVLPISRNGHWRLEFNLQGGWFTCKYDPYQFENLVNPDYHDALYYYSWTGAAQDFKKRQYHFNWFGPTRVGITLVYDLLYRKASKKGVTFRSYEVYGANRANEAKRADEANGSHEAHGAHGAHGTHGAQHPQKNQERRVEP